MILLEWNALRVGEQVLVHDEHDAMMPLIAGVVTMIRISTRGSNDLAIRVSPHGLPNSVRRPRRLAVHLQRLDPDELCWRCAIANTAHAIGRRPHDLLPGHETLPAGTTHSTG